MKVSKFGGTSLACAGQIEKVLSIVRSDSERRYIVVSAPGKRYAHDQKITDLFYEWHRHFELGLSSNEIEQIIYVRYKEIVYDLRINFDLDHELAEISRKIEEGASADYAASRGEYLNGRIIAVALGYEFVDPKSCIYFDELGRYYKADELLQSVLHGKRAVIPGFYGSVLGGPIKTFPRGGSDITGAIVSRAMRASLYENWTDVSGLLMADPRVVKNPRKIETVTYRELRELSYMGASVFHEEAMFPVQEAGITTNILNTNEPSDQGTYVVAKGSRRSNTHAIVGIAGRKDFTVITIEKMMMNQQVGFVRRILAVLEANGVSFEHMPSGIDTLSIIIDDKQLDGKLEGIVREIRDACLPDTIETYPNMAMIATVGRSMAYTPGIAAKLFSAVADAGINIRMINQGSSEINIIIGVENDYYEDAVRAIYGAFVE